MALSRSARLGAVVTAALSFLTVAASSAPTPGAPGIGDTYFPLAGNGGFDARHYDLDIAYAPDTGRLDGRTTITARATQNLSSFDLDLQQLTVTRVEVDGRRARFTRDGDELRVTPRGVLREGRTFRVAVTYGGMPQPLSGPIVFGSKYGWMRTEDGVFVACEPNAASTWFPSSDHPSDKATYDIRVKAPKGLTAVSNGRLVSTSDRGGSTYTHWRESRPMATYLATATIGKFDVRTGRTPSGIPIYVAIDPKLRNSNSVDVYAVTAAATDYWSQVFGPYPFEETGAIVDDMPEAGFSLEVQSKPAYSAVRNETTIVHELAHQWFGDSVSVRRWKDVWLNEASPPTPSGCGPSTRHPLGARLLPRRLRLPPRRQPLLAGRGGRPAARHDVRLRRLPARRDDAPGAARAHRRPGLLPPAAGLDGPAPLRQRGHRRLRAPGGTDLRAAARRPLRHLAVHDLETRPVNAGIHGGPCIARPTPRAE